jgi:hypothetical protein
LQRPYTNNLIHYLVTESNIKPTSASIIDSPPGDLHSSASKLSEDLSLPAEETDAQVTPPEDSQLSPIISSDQPQRIDLDHIESLSDCTPLALAEDQNIANSIPEWIQDTIPDALGQETSTDVTVSIDPPGPAEEEKSSLVISKSKKAKKNNKRKKSAGKDLGISVEQNTVE